MGEVLIVIYNDLILFFDGQNDPWSLLLNTDDQKIHRRAEKSIKLEFQIRIILSISKFQKIYICKVSH